MTMKNVTGKQSLISGVMSLTNIRKQFNNWVCVKVNLTFNK